MAKRQYATACTILLFHDELYEVSRRNWKPTSELRWKNNRLQQRWIQKVKFVVEDTENHLYEVHEDFCWKTIPDVTLEEMSQ